MRKDIRPVTQWDGSFWDECKCSLDYVPIFSLSYPALLGCVRTYSWCMIPLEERSFGIHYWYILLPNLLWGIEFWLITGFPLCFFLINKNIYKGRQYCILVFEKKKPRKSSVIIHKQNIVSMSIYWDATLTPNISVDKFYGKSRFNARFIKRKLCHFATNTVSTKRDIFLS